MFHSPGKEVTQSEEIADLNKIAELFNAYCCEMPVK
jgi:hypothetical protein